MIKRRSILSVPGNIPKMHTKAMLSDADCIQFDLENIADTIKNISNTVKVISLRINPVTSVYAIDDIELLKELISYLDILVLPKVENVADVHFIDYFIKAIENDRNTKYNLKLDVSTETALGIENISSIAKASHRTGALVFGVADYANSISAKLVSLSGHGEGDLDNNIYRWSYAVSRMINTAKANRLEAIDAPYGDFKDTDSLIKAANYSASIGFDGKWAIHPNQIQHINKCFDYSDDELENAREIVNIFKNTISKNRGATSHNGKMIDVATYKLAKKILS